ncbi:unnamed protein product [Protopolystoma xenopodis]|uniref:Uncharacterized protein n=1 Tax=Protopolystoma xenopodis TaxID=117903 RepID=A0A3S5APV2_9PLAT|nr:unnamed protein product [Protopolystoma xenopodis]
MLCGADRLVGTDDRVSTDDRVGADSLFGTDVHFVAVDAVSTNVLWIVLVLIAFVGTDGFVGTDDRVCADGPVNTDDRIVTDCLVGTDDRIGTDDLLVQMIVFVLMVLLVLMVVLLQLTLFVLMLCGAVGLVRTDGRITTDDRVGTDGLVGSDSFVVPEFDTVYAFDAGGCVLLEALSLLPHFVLFEVVLLLPFYTLLALSACPRRPVNQSSLSASIRRHVGTVTDGQSRQDDQLAFEEDERKSACKPSRVQTLAAGSRKLHLSAQVRAASLPPRYRLVAVQLAPRYHLAGRQELSSGRQGAPTCQPLSFWPADRLVGWPGGLFSLLQPPALDRRHDPPISQPSVSPTIPLIHPSTRPPVHPSMCPFVRSSGSFTPRLGKVRPAILVAMPTGLCTRLDMQANWARRLLHKRWQNSHAPPNVEVVSCVYKHCAIITHFREAGQRMHECAPTGFVLGQPYFGWLAKASDKTVLMHNLTTHRTDQPHFGFPVPRQLAQPRLHVVAYCRESLCQPAGLFEATTPPDNAGQKRRTCKASAAMEDL